MQKLLTLLIICITLNAKADSWVQKANYPGAYKAYPFSFSIGNKGYVGTGRDSAGNSSSEFWEYNTTLNAWTQKANFGGLARWGASGLSIGNKGYAGLGTDSWTVYQDFWQYDPISNMWNQKANFGGGSRFEATGFSISNFGYISTGRNNSVAILNDLWQYNPLSDSWIQKNSLPGFARNGASSFVIGNKGYIMGGNYGGTPLTDLWEYNSNSNSWMQRAFLPADPRVVAVAFSICNKGYFGLGIGGLMINTLLQDLWEYNAINDSWTQKLSFPGSGRCEAAYFVVANKAYIGLGVSTSPNVYNDFYEYTPDSACATGIADVAADHFDFSIYPNPAKGEFKVSGLQFKFNIHNQIKIIDAKGKIVFSKQYPITASTITLPTANLPTGIYYVQVSEGENKAVRKVVVE